MIEAIKFADNPNFKLMDSFILYSVYFACKKPNKLQYIFVGEVELAVDI
jgi:hypothetical protein